jgi:hypothetical protein
MRAYVVDTVLAKGGDLNKSCREHLVARGWFFCEAVLYIIGAVPVGLFCLHEVSDSLVVCSIYSGH